MHNRSTRLPVTRREFMKTTGGGIGLLAFSGFAPAFLARSAYAGAPAPERDRSILVVIQLAGGNDGLNTVVPYTDDRYYNLRPTLALHKDAGLHPIDAHSALHPACEPISRLWQDGQLSILRNVGYPNPNRSHFRSMEIWETASDSDQNAHTGWLGRYLDHACEGQPTDSDGPAAIHLGDQIPQSYLAGQPHSLFGMPGRGQVRRSRGRGIELLEAMLADPTLQPNANANYLRHTLMDSLVTERRIQDLITGYQPMAAYPGHNLAQSLQRVAALIAAGLPTRLYFVSQGGYDTHANQANRHASLLGQLATAMAAFQEDLRKHRLDEQVLTMTFSEFGRRPNENSGQGTDHGTAAPLFVMGGNIRQTLIGEPPDLDLAQNRDPGFSTDFRQVYATVLQKWLRTDPKKILGREFPLLDFI